MSDQYRAHHARRRPYLLQRQAILAAVRHWFAGAGFVEVETPALQVSPGLEPHLHAFATEWDLPTGEVRQRYLHTSPEFAMKKLLAAGEERIFQIARVFRNREGSATHSPEFSMLEWYRAHGTTADLIADCTGILRAALAATGRSHLVWQGAEAHMADGLECVSVVEAFARYAGVTLALPDGAPEAYHRTQLRAEAMRIGLHTADDDRWDDIFHRIALARIEPKLGHPKPTILTNYPISMAALARPHPIDPRLADRFELYVAGLELANAFGELTDPVEQRRRFEADRALARMLYGRAYPIDEAFLAALTHMPPAAGIALGVDRLVMLATGATHIDQVLWASPA